MDRNAVGHHIKGDMTFILEKAVHQSFGQIGLFSVGNKTIFVQKRKTVMMAMYRTPPPNMLGGGVAWTPPPPPQI